MNSVQPRHPIHPKRKCRVLVVEDDALTHTTLRRVLELAGHKVEAVGTVETALRRLNEAECVVLDLRLPDGCGLEVLRGVRERGLYVRVTVHTGCADAALIKKVKELNPDALFIKPFNPDDILAWLDNPRP
jgi:DNA-binding response OmpR family regulator